MISFRNVTKKFGTHIVLDKLSFDIQPNEFVVMKGASGAGKSTIISMLIGAEVPDDGSVEVDGVIVNAMDEDTKQLYRRKVGVVFQDYKILPRKTVFENVAFAMEVCGESDEAIQRRVPMILEKVGLLSFQDKFPENLSGGETQRLAIARALVHKPRLILADEPSGNLDEENVRGIIRLFKKLHEEGATILMTTHDPLVEELAKGRTIYLENGKIV
ncbi:ATP-binding cassette domain-containing protein [Candidatus Peregrinibacteria bacterium]|nr:ATP-binding cassette domain-containing protein [Candidatus Peregrinibacteria bacterium]